MPQQILDEKYLHEKASGEKTLSMWGPILYGKYHLFNREVSVFGAKGTYSLDIDAVLNLAKSIKSETTTDYAWQKALALYFYPSIGSLDFIRAFYGRVWANDITELGPQIKFMKNINDLRAKGFGIEKISEVSSIGLVYDGGEGLPPLTSYINYEAFGSYLSLQSATSRGLWYLGDKFYVHSPTTPGAQAAQTRLLADINSLWNIKKVFAAGVPANLTKAKPLKEILKIRIPIVAKNETEFDDLKAMIANISKMLDLQSGLEREYVDHVSRYIRPDSFSIDEITSNIQSVFQRTLPEYEQAIAPDFVEEHTLPDHNTFSMEINTFESLKFDNPELLDGERNYHQFVTLSGKLDVFVDSLKEQSYPQGLLGPGYSWWVKEKETKTSNYYQKWTDYVSNTTLDHPLWSGGITSLDHFKNTILLDDSIELIGNKPANVMMYPFYNKLSFYTEPTFPGSLKPLFFGGTQQYTSFQLVNMGASGVGQHEKLVEIAKTRELEYSPEYSIVKRIMESKTQTSAIPSHFRSLEGTSDYVNQIHEDWTITPLVMTDGLLPDEPEEAQYIPRDTLNLTRFIRNLYTFGGFLYNYYLPKVKPVQFEGEIQLYEDPTNVPILDVNDTTLRRPQDLLLDEGKTNSPESHAPDAHYTTFFKDYGEDHYIPFLKFMHGFDGVATPLGASGADINEHIKDWTTEILKLLYEKTRSFSQIMNGDLAHSETIGYMIEKIRVDDDATEEVKKRILFLNSGKRSVFHYLDSQVKFEVGYKYKVTALQLIIGTKYAYTRIVGLPRGGDVFTENVESQVSANDLTYALWEKFKVPNFGFNIDVESVPDPLIVELPYFETPVVKITDLYPTPPEVEPIPFKNNDKQFLFNLREGPLTAKVPPIKVFSDDTSVIYEQYYNQYFSSNILDFDEELGFMNISNEKKDAIKQKWDVTIPESYNSPLDPGVSIDRNFLLRDNNFPLLYKTDDMPVSYEIFRLRYEPTSYLDFGDATYDNSVDGNFYKEIDLKGASSMGHIENIVPNKKYYYIFRAKDHRGKVSNPTSIYEIELVNNSGAVYLRTKILKFKDPKRTYTKPMRKLLQIRPTYEQAILNETIAGIHGNHTDGPGGEEWTTAAYAVVGAGWKPHIKSDTIPIGLTSSGKSLFRDDTFRKFKVRLTSKSTGRKLDFNLKFSHTHNKTEEERFLVTTLSEILEPPETPIIVPTLPESGVAVVTDPEDEQCP